MARLVYQAPGVYVEEMPSAQKPIAGVGTNTVGFIGVIGDEIQYPVPNEHYDPTHAAIKAEDPEISKQKARNQEGRDRSKGKREEQCAKGA